MIRMARFWLKRHFPFLPISTADLESDVEESETDVGVEKKNNKLTLKLFERKRKKVIIEKRIKNGYEFKKTLESNEFPLDVQGIVLSGSMVEYIPVTIGRFSNLTTLSLRNNAIMEMPWSIIYLRRLEILDLSKNSLTELPPIIGYLAALKQLSLMENELTFLPTSLLKLTKLEVLNLKGNVHMESPPLSICSQGKEAIFSELMRRHGRVNTLAGSTPWYSEDRTNYRNRSLSSGVDSLMKIAIDCILECQIDYLSPINVPPPLKTFLQTMEDTRAKEIQISFCNSCRSFFSTVLLFDTHYCRPRNGQPVQ